MMGQPNQKLRQARVDVGLSQDDVAKKLKIGVKTYSGWECGEHKPYLRHMQVEQARALYYFGATGDALQVYSQIVNPKTLATIELFKEKVTENLRIEIILDMSRASMKGPGRDMKKAIEYWEAAIDGAKCMKNEGIYSEALKIHDAMDYAFHGEKQVYNLRDHFRRGKGWK
jgi:transcriptional regulator with XRE-family HTH domain